jgi:hypothetical protein
MLNLIRFGVIAAGSALAAVESFNTTSSINLDGTLGAFPNFNNGVFDTSKKGHNCQEVAEKCRLVWNECLSKGSCCGAFYSQSNVIFNAKETSLCDCKVYEGSSDYYFIHMPEDAEPLFSFDTTDEDDVTFIEDLADVIHRLAWGRLYSKEIAEKRVSCSPSEKSQKKLMLFL